MHEHHCCDMDWVLGGDRVHNAVVMIEGFDHLKQANYTVKGWSGSSNNEVAGRFGGFAAEQANNQRTRILPSTYTELWCGFAFKGNSIGGAALTALYILQTAAAVQVAHVTVSATGKIEIRNAANTIVATGTTTILANQWNYVELHVFVNTGTPASGTVELRLNGAAEIASTAANLGSTAINQVRIMSNTGGASNDFDDMYCVDNTGSAPNNTFLGDVRVVTIMPTADGTYSAWTPAGGGSHFSKVNETSGSSFPDGDTSYVSDSTPNDLDSYVCADIDAGATVYGVQHNIYARKDDANTRQIAPLIRQASTDYVGTTVTLTATYAFYTQLYDKDPTSSAWTAANVNGDEFGVKEIA